MNIFMIVKGDVEEIYVDAIVNAINISLLGGGCVDGAIHRNGGSQILDQCRQVSSRQGGCEVGYAVITTAGDLPAVYVGHHWHDGIHRKAETLEKTCIGFFKLIK